MRRRTFRINLSGISDKTIPEIGKSYVFDTLGLRTPSAQWGFINITRFSDRNPGGIKRSYGHVSMEAAAFEALILTMRAYSSATHWRDSRDEEGWPSFSQVASDSRPVRGFVHEQP